MSNASNDGREPVEVLAEEFLDRRRQGETPSLREYIDRYPDLAEEIREVFPALVLMDEVDPASAELSHGDSGATASAAEPALRQLGDYRILREIGQGGMGIVYEAEQVSLGRHVALKVMPRKMLADAKQKRRFEREAKAAARLHHTNIVPVFGVGEHCGLPYYVMQFIQGLGLDLVLEELKRLKAGSPATTAFSGGELRVSHRELSAANIARSLATGTFQGSLDFAAGNPSPVQPHDNGATSPIDASRASERTPDSASRPGTLSDSFTLSSSSVVLPGGSHPSYKSKTKKQTYWHSVASIGLQVANALEYAHKQGILHRDIKPSNLLLDTQGTVWVTDFGLAKTEGGENLTHTGDILGTLRYMPPEAFEGKAQPSSDVYSLGLTLFEMLAFRPAYDERERNKLIKQVTSGEHPRLVRLNRQVPRDLETIVHKAIEHDPGHRYASGSELAADLQRFMDDEPIHARRASMAERALRWCRRNPAVATLTAAFLVALVGGLIGVTTQWLRAEQNAEQAWDSESRANANASEARDKEAEAMRERDAAQALNDRLRRVNYASQMNLAQAAWESDNVGRVRELLDQQLPKPGETDVRGFEWHYWQRMCTTELRTVTIASRPDDVYFRQSLSGDGTRLACAIPEERTDDYQAKVWDTATGKELLSIKLPAGPDMHATADLSHDGSRLVTILVPNRPAGNRRRTEFHVWDVATGKEISAIPLKGVFSGFGLTGNFMSADGTRLVTNDSRDANLSKDSTGLTIWDGQTGKEILRFAVNATVQKPVFSPDGRRVAATVTAPGFKKSALEADSKVYVWDADSGEEITSMGRLKGFFGEVVFSPDGKLLAAAGNTNLPMEIQVWDAETGKELQKFSSTQGPYPAQLVFSPDGKLLTCCGSGAAIRVWDTTTGKLRRTLKGHTKLMSTAAFTHDGRQLVSASLDGTVKTWDVSTEEESVDDTGGSLGLAQGVISADGSRLARTGGEDVVNVSGVDVLDSTGKALFTAKVPSGHSHGMTFSPDGRNFAVTWHEWKLDEDLAEAYEFQLWDAAAGKARFTIKAPGLTMFDSPVFSPDGTRVAHAAAMIDPKTQLPSRGEARILDVATGKELLTLHSRSAGYLHGLAFSPDGAWLAAPCSNLSKRTVSADDSAAVIIWNAATGKELGRLDSRGNRFTNIHFSPDGKWIAAANGSFDGAGDIEVWRLVPDRLHATKAAQYILKGHSGTVQSLAFSPDGRRLVSAAGLQLGSSAEIKVWDVASGQELLSIKANGVDLGTVRFSPDGRRLLGIRTKTDHPGGPLMVWDATPLDKEGARAGDEVGGRR